jgi:hypothetical protein
VQTLADQRPQIIAHAVFVPDSTREQALHTVGSGLPSLFGDLPTIFAGDITEESLEVEEHMLANFRASNARTQTLMQTV